VTTYSNRAQSGITCNGQVFANWTVLRRAGAFGQSATHWARCRCGNEEILTRVALRRAVARDQQGCRVCGATARKAKAA
jgi:hypothetical protein